MRDERRLVVVDVLERRDAGDEIELFRREQIFTGETEVELHLWKLLCHVGGKSPAIVARDARASVEGVNVANDASGRKLKFLRRIPIDPFTNSTEWGLRAYQDRPDAFSWGGQNVYDVYTKSPGTALDGTKYKDW